VTSTDAFALKNSDLNPFLFAEVGTEANGSVLTMLSVLARLGQDPWAEAARWTNLPKAAATECLVRCIGAMPLGPRTQADASATAARLLLLLPVQTRTRGDGSRLAATASAVPNWVPVALLALFFLAGLALNLTSAPVSPAGPAVAAAQTAPVNPE